MPKQFVLPDLGEGVKEGQVLRLLVAEGDRVDEDQLLMEVETDKSAVEIPSPYAGVITRWHVSEQQTVNVGDAMVTFELDGENGDGAAATAKPAAATPEPPKTASPSGIAAAVNEAVEDATTAPRKPASPAVRKLARSLGVDLGAVNGSGPGGRVLRADVQNAASGAGAATSASSTIGSTRASSASRAGGTPAPQVRSAPRTPAPTAEPEGTDDTDPIGPIRRAPMSRTRRVIAEVMARSASTIPHVTDCDDADVTELDRLRRGYNETAADDERLNLLPFVIRALCRALRAFPIFNASFDEERGEIIYKRYCNIAVGVQTERGLVAPVLHNADQMTIPEIGATLRRLALNARDGHVALDETRGATYTVSNAGAMGGSRYSTPIITPPQVAVLAVGRSRLHAWVVDGVVEPRLIMPLSHSMDHRVIDGAIEIAFMQQLIGDLEQPGASSFDGNLMVVGEFTTETELVVIGGGPGGYTAAFRAAELGVETTVVDDRERLGGGWLHEGCVLSKNLVQVADVVRTAAQAASYGVHFDPPRYDLDRIRAALTETVDHISADLAKACDAGQVTHIQGRATFDDSRQLTVHGASTARLHFRRAIIATGCDAPPVPGIPMDSPRVLSQRDALMIPVVPDTLLVCGGNTTAIEFAGAYAALGSRVTLAVSSERLVAAADEDLIAALRGILDEQLTAVHVGTHVVAAEERDDGIFVTFACERGAGPPEPALFDMVLAVSCREANVEGLGLERTKVARAPNGFVTVNDKLTTADPRILAVGDVTGPPLLAQRAMHQGRVAAEVVAGWGSAFDARAAPMVLFTSPPVAWCGLTERDAASRGQAVRVSRTPGLAGQGKGVSPNNSFTKIVYDQDTSLVLGLGVVGPGAAEMIAEGALAIEMGAVTGDLAATLHPHPTRSESIARAAQNTQRN